MAKWETSVWREYEDAPKDGTSILVDDGGYSNSVRWIEYDADTKEEVGEDGYWSYCDKLLAEVAPSGPEVPFTWARDPAAVRKG